MSQSRVLKSPDSPLVQIQVNAYCHNPQCKRLHTYTIRPDDFGRIAFEWQYKHRHCFEQGYHIGFDTPKRVVPRGFDDRIFERAGEAPWWLDYQHNANFTTEYVADAAFTLTLANLGTSSTWVAGRESTSVSNTTNKYLDYAISGLVTTGTTPTVSTEMRLYYVRPYEDTPTWGGGIAGTGDAAATITNTQILASMLLGWSGTVSATTNVAYPIQKALTMAEAFGIVPNAFLVFFAHATAVNLYNNAVNNNSIYYKGMYLSVA